MASNHARFELKAEIIRKHGSLAAFARSLRDSGLDITDQRLSRIIWKRTQKIKPEERRMISWKLQTSAKELEL